MSMPRWCWGLAARARCGQGVVSDGLSGDFVTNKLIENQAGLLFSAVSVFCSLRCRQLWMQRDR